MLGREPWRVRPICDLLDAGMQHQSIKATCRCGRAEVFHAVGLWYRFQTKGWPDVLREVPRRLRCRQCGRRSPRIEFVWLTKATVPLPLPSDLEWKKALSRRR